MRAGVGARERARLSRRVRDPRRARGAARAQLPVPLPLRVQRRDDRPARRRARDAADARRPTRRRPTTMRDTIAAIVERADRVAGRAPLDAARSARLALRADRRPVARISRRTASTSRCTAATRGCRTRPRGSRPGSSGSRRSCARRVPCVYAPPGRDHEIVAQPRPRGSACRSRRGPRSACRRPASSSPTTSTSLPRADARACSRQRRPDQILFAHASPWTEDCPIAPDVTTLLYQTLVAPWGEVMMVDPDTREVTQSPADARSVDEIAAEIVGEPGPGRRRARAPTSPRGGTRSSSARGRSIRARDRGCGPAGRSPSNRFE